MRRDDVERALDALASEVGLPRADASARIERGRRRTRQRRIVVIGVAAGVVAVVAAVGVLAHDDTLEDAAAPHRRAPDPAACRRGAAREIVAPTSLEAWKCRNPIEYTADGGQTWRSTQLPGTPTTACCAPRSPGVPRGWWRATPPDTSASSASATAAPTSTRSHYLA